jgi:hypothetical protein
MPTQAESKNPTGTGPTEDEWLTDPIAAGLKADGIPVTRKSWIERHWGETPSEWNAEHEAELPEHLQDWDKFEKC